MVVKRRFRRFLMPLALYCAAGAVVSYFVHHANHGRRGAEARRELKVKAYELGRELEASKIERHEWDLLEEQGRIMLGRVHRNDLVIITGP